MKEKKSITELARKRFDEATRSYAEFRKQANDDTRFVLGDSENGYQWPNELHRQRTLVDKKPCLTINVTAQHCNQIINNIRLNRPQGKILANGDGATKEAANILAGLIRNIQQQSKADTAHDTAAMHSIYGGEGYWRIITEYESESSFKQCIKIKSIPNPRLVLIDPGAVELDKSDAEWAFIFEDISKDEFRDKYPDIEPSNWVRNMNNWATEDTVRIAEYFYCDYVDDTALQLIDGTTILKSQANGTEQVLKERKTKVRKWKWAKLAGYEDEPVEEGEWAGALIPIIAVTGVEVNVDGEIIRKGQVRDLKDTARMVNFSYSSAIEAISLQNKIPYIAAVEAIDGFKNQWANANLSSTAYLPYNAYDKDGNQLPQPARQPAATPPMAHLQMLQISTEQMRAASGQQASNFGIKSEAQSGVGIQRLKQQGDVATFHFPDNLQRALHYEMEVLIDLIPKIMDVEQVLTIQNLDGTQEKVMLKPDMQQAHAETDHEEVKIIFNPNIGKYGVTIDIGASFSTQRQEAATALTHLFGQDPQLMAIAGDLYFKALDLPNSEAFVERLHAALPPQLQQAENKGEPGDPQQNAQMDQMAQQGEHMSQMVQQLQDELDKTKSENEAKLLQLSVQLNQERIQNQKIQFDAYTANELAKIEQAKEDAIKEVIQHQRGIE